MGTPARSNSTANVSRKRCACPFGTFASLKSLRNRVCQLRTMLSSFPLPLQKKNFSVTFGVASNADKTNPGRIVFTGTPVFCVYEKETIQMMREGQNKYTALTSFETRREMEKDHPHLSPSQRAAVEQILASRDQVTALEGVAGAGKTTSLAVVREAAEREGYKVEGFAPTSRASQKLAEAGIESSTLQRHLARSEAPHDGQKRLYILDESSLTSTKQMNEFLHRLKGILREGTPSSK